MLLYDIFRLMEAEDERPHWEALEQTGYYGKQAAGSVPFARDTKRFLIAHRSRYVEQPGTWGTWGGAVNEGESPEGTARREFQEESDYHGAVQMVPLYVFRDKSFRYSNYLAIVEHEFKPHFGTHYPQPGWETQGYRWVAYGDWPQPMHFGLKALLNDPGSQATIKKLIG